MKDLLVLLSPVFWSIKNDLFSFNKAFYKKIFFYLLSSILFIFLLTSLLNAGMIKLQSLSPEVFNALLIKGYSLIFIIIFFSQIINGFIVSLDRYYQSSELELLLTSPVNRTSLFFSRLIETHLKTSWMLIIFGLPLLISVGILFHVNFIYYPLSLLLFMAFSAIPVNIGISITIMLSVVFHVKKIKKFIFSAGIVTVVAFVALLRTFSPERFVNPELFANLKLFLIGLQTPSFILLPNRWLSESLFNYLNRDYNNTFIFVALLIVTSYLTSIFLMSIYRKHHYKGWSILQGEGGILKHREERITSISNLAKRRFHSRVLEKLLSLFNAKPMALLKKDLLYQIRDIKKLHQHLILITLIIIYLVSISSLPLNWIGYTYQLKYFVFFFNLGLILIIMASLASKLVYPAILAERSSLWIVKTSPITSKQYIRAKFIFLFVPIFFLGESLTIFSSFFINIEKMVFALSILTTGLLSFSLVSMDINFGISDLKGTINKDDNGEIKTDNAICMIASVLFVLFILVIEMIPIYLYFLKESAKIEFTQRAWLIIGGVVFILLLVNILITAVSMHLSIKRFDKLQIS